MSFSIRAFWRPNNARPGLGEPPPNGWAGAQMHQQDAPTSTQGTEIRPGGRNVWLWLMLSKFAREQHQTVSAPAKKRSGALRRGRRTATLGGGSLCRHVPGGGFLARRTITPIGPRTVGSTPALRSNVHKSTTFCGIRVPSIQRVAAQPQIEAKPVHLLR